MAGGSGNGNNNGNGSREYCLRWNNHQPNLVTFFGTLYDTEAFVDVTLVSSEGRKVPAHKLVLSACSPYFQHVFENNPCKHPVVILKDVQYVDLEAIVKFAYNGEVNISQDRMNSILKTANSLQVKGLAEVPAEELKRVSSVVSETHRPHQHQHQHTPHLTSSASWDASDSLHDIPRKKLKKSASATASYVHGTSGNHNTNGDHSSSIDSGVGTSVSRSIDDSTMTPEDIPATSASTSTSSVVQKRSSTLPAPPPLLPKSKSLDIHRDTDNHEMKGSLSDHQRQSYDDSAVGFDQGYNDDVEVAEEDDDMKMEDYNDEQERDLEDGEIGYYDEGEYYDGEVYAYDESGSLQTLNGNIKGKMSLLKSGRNQPHSPTSLSRVRELLHNSSLKTSNSNNGQVFRRRSERTVIDPDRLEQAMEFLRNGSSSERRRRGRPLLRQHRIKRSDNEPAIVGVRDREQYGSGSIREQCHSISGGEESYDSGSEERDSYRRRSDRDRETSPRPHNSPIHQSNVPILRVTQPNSPTPPSSPLLPPHSHSHNNSHRIEEHSPVIVSSVSLASTHHLSSQLQQSSSSSSSTSTMVITSTASGSTLLKVPTIINSEPLTVTSSGGSHLVKQISQPGSLPSHTLTPLGGSLISGSPVIRRQNSTPAPTSSGLQQSRIIQPLKHGHGTVFQLIQSAPSTDNTRTSSSSSEEKTFIIDLVAPVIPPPSSGELRVKQLIKDSSGEHSFSREDSTSAEDIASSTSSSSFDDGLPVNRSGHCPALRPGPALGCNFCWNSVDNCGRILRRKTKYHCPECHINLCIVPCFQEYHEKADKKKKPRSKLLLPKPSSM